MKTETMTPRWVVENFLPDYEKRYREERNRFEFAVGSEASNPEFVRRFIRRFFPEALSELLRAQRTNCAEAYDAYPFDGIICARIQDAPIPEPKNIERL